MTRGQGEGWGEGKETKEREKIHWLIPVLLSEIHTLASKTPSSESFSGLRTHQNSKFYS